MTSSQFTFSGSGELTKDVVQQTSFTGITNILVQGYSSIGNEAFKRNGLIGEVTIGTSVNSIMRHAFKECGALSALNFEAPSNLQLIGQDAFMSTGIASLDFPESISNIGSFSFENCLQLSSVTFSGSSNLQIIDWNAFSRSKISTISIPASCIEFGYGIFMLCTNLTSIHFEDNTQLATIGYNAFYGCSSLTDITIPASVVRMGYDSASLQNGIFTDCTSLTSVTFEAGSQLNPEIFNPTNMFISTSLTNFSAPQNVLTAFGIDGPGSNISVGGKVVASVTLSTVAAPTTTVIAVKTGWNLISGTVNGATIEGDNISQVYLPSGAQYTEQSKNTEGKYVLEDASTCFWVKSSSNSEISHVHSGGAPSESTKLLSKGWNFIGNNVTNGTISNDSHDCQIFIYIYNPEAESYDQISPTAEIQINTGLIVYSSDNTELIIN
tara:strand:+ start:92 stop:1408 length:1317 start_codon:yes stop_codon:yes gene_type:complete